MTSCGQCEALEAANARNRELQEQVAQLEKERAELHEQLAEMTKLCELQQADLERYRKAYEASRPNHPERVAREQLQLAFARVLEALADAEPANDGDDDQAVESGDEQTPTQPSGGERKRKRRHPHGRRPLDLSGLEVKEIVLDPAEVKSAPEGWVLIGQEVADRVAWRPGAYIRIRFVRPKYIAASALAAEAPTSGTDGEASSNSDAAVADATGELSEVASEVADDESTTVIIAPLPDSVWPRFMADPSAIGQVIVSKYDDLLPLNRQEGISAPESGRAECRVRERGGNDAASGSVVGARKLCVFLNPSGAPRVLQSDGSKCSDTPPSAIRARAPHPVVPCGWLC
jgi:hypothetical protein